MVKVYVRSGELHATVEANHFPETAEEVKVVLKEAVKQFIKGAKMGRIARIAHCPKYAKGNDKLIPSELLIEAYAESHKAE